MSGATAHFLDGDHDGRLHLHHGPIDLVIGVDGFGAHGIGTGYDPAPASAPASRLRRRAFEAAHARFQTILGELVEELPLLKAQAWPGSRMPQGLVARRMMAAVLPFAPDHFITPMAAVAGAVADETMAAMLAAFEQDERPHRLYVNNGGDIALHLESDARFRVGISHETGRGLGDLAVTADDPVRGIATSGRGGRSLSMGIAESVTILARNAAAADAAATLVANAVDLPGHPAIRRAPADSVVDDSDLGDRLVVIGVDALEPAQVDAALAQGVITAEAFQRSGLLHSAALFLDGRARIVNAAATPTLGPRLALIQPQTPRPEISHHA